MRTMVHHCDRLCWMTKLSTHSRLKGHCLLCGFTRGNHRENVAHRVRKQIGQVRRFSKRVTTED